MAFVEYLFASYCQQTKLNFATRYEMVDGKIIPPRNHAYLLWVILVQTFFFVYKLGQEVKQRYFEEQQP